MNEMLNSYLGGFTCEYMLHQCLVILMLFIIGLVFNLAVKKGRISVDELLISYPVGLAVFALLGVLMLVAGIPYNTKMVTILVLVIVAVTVCITFRKNNRDELFNNLAGINRRMLVIGIITVLFIAIIATSGLMSVSLSNDSMYYYFMYPQAIVHFEGYRSEFNVFLTDVGPASPVIGTLPFLYGFNETFGIQAFLNINTFILVIYAIYNQGMILINDKKRVVSVAIIGGLLLLSLMPYVIMCKWAMSNGYFMNYMFICVYLIQKHLNCNDERSSMLKSDLILTGITLTLLSLLRMEGCIIAILLVLCFSVLEYSNTELSLYLLAPVAIMSVLYDIKIFVIMKINAPYTFLTPSKAKLQLIVLVLAFIYLLVIRGRLFVRIFSRLELLMPVGLVAVNILLFVYDRELFCENLKAFSYNLFNQGGWGLFPVIIISIMLLLVVTSKRGTIRYGFWDTIFINYLLAAIAVCFAREGALQTNAGDSGNRVLLQCILIAFMAMMSHILQFLKQGTTGNIE